MAATTRLAKEFREVERERRRQAGAAGGAPSTPPPGGLVLAPVGEGEDLLKWRALIGGPEGTPFEGGVFRLAISVPKEYPIAPPKVSFATRVFHPNVHWKTGEICLDILKTQWSPAWTLQSVCRAVVALLSCPEGDSPLNCDAGNMLRAGDDRGYNSMAGMYTRRYAK